MRKLLLVSVLLPLFGGCESLRRVEVWKQQTLFAPRSSEYAPMPGPAGPQFAAPQVLAPSAPSSWTVASPVQPDAMIVPEPEPSFPGLESAEEVHGILEQP